MKSIIKSLAVLTATLIPLMSCDKAEKEVVKSELSIVTESNVTVPYTGNDNLLVEFICKGDWSATLNFDGSEEFAEIKGESRGSGSGSVIVSVKENESSSERTATLAIEVADLKETVLIKQDGKKLNITFKHPSLAFTQEQLDKLKNAYIAGKDLAADQKSSLQEAIGWVMTRADGGLGYNPDTVTDEQKKENTDMETLYKRAKGPATLTMHLILASQITDDETKKEEYISKAVAIMYSWANALVSVEYPVSSETPEGDAEPKTGAGMFLSRVMFPYFVTYDILKNTNYIPAAQKTVIENWFRSIVKHIKASMNAWDSNDYFNKQEWQNHLAAHIWGLLAIGYALEDASLVQFAIDSPENPRDFYEMIQGNIFMEGDTPCHRERAGAPAVQTGEIYDRYRHDTGPLKGLQYTSLSLQVLSSAARICTNNGIDMYAYTAPTGENLRLAYEFYADFYISGDTSIKGGYYTGENERIGKAGDFISLYELGYNAYPDSKKIKEVIDKIAKRGDNKPTLHDNLGYLRLYSVDVDATN